MKRLYLASIAFVFATVSAGAPAQVALPDMGASTGKILSPAEARELGAQAYHRFRAENAVVEDPLLNEYLDSVGQRLAAHDAETSQDFTFFVVAEDSVNAFAMPGGFIGVHAGLITTAQSEDELAAVLAHEIAHITQQHLLRRIEDQRQMTLPTMLAMLGLIIASGGQAGPAAVIGGQAALIQNLINFTRAHEAEADRIGIRTMADAGYRPEAMAVFFARMEKSNLAYGDGPSKFLRTHPVSSSRIAEAKSYAAGLQTAPGFRGQPEYFLLMRARARALGADRATEALDYFRATLPNVTRTMEVYALKYGKALALIETRRGAEAIDILQTLIEEDGSRLPYDLALADAWMQMGKTERALERYRGLNRLHGGRFAVTVAYARALLRAGQPEQAEALLREEVIRQPDNAWLHHLYAEAANAAGKPVDALIAIAEAYYLEGRIADAMQLLEQGKENDRFSNLQRGRLSARLEEMKGTLTEEELEEIEENRPYL